MSYIGAEPDGMGKAQRWTYTTVGTGTVVSADDAGVPIGYTVGQVSVYLNGVKQVIPTDVVASNGSTITFTSSYASGDVVEVVALSIFSATTVEWTSLVGDYAKIPSATTTERDALTPVVGMLLYNTTIGLLEQYNAVGWQAIDSPPTITSFTYPDSTTALDPAGSTTATLVITGSNFSVGATVLIDGTAPTATTRNSVTQITITGFPAKSAATYSAGLKVTNASGLAASADIAYDALPAWTTAAGALGTFIDGAYTNSSASTIRIVAAEGSDTIDYAQVSDAEGGTIITSGVAGLTLGTTGANAGYLTGTLAGTDSTTYTFYAKAQDDENQFSAVRLFNIITKDYAATGGTVIESGAYNGDYRSHTFTSTGSDFVSITTLTVDILVVAGGGGGGYDVGGGGGAGGMAVWSSYSLPAGTYAVVVGLGGAGSNASGSNGLAGGLSRFGTTLSSITGGGGGAYWDNNGNTGGSGGGGGGWTSIGSGGTTSYSTAGTSIDSSAGTAYGSAGGATSGASSSTGGGGGGAGGVGAVSVVGATSTVAGGIGKANAFRTGSNVTYAEGGRGFGNSTTSSVAGGANTGDGGDGGGSPGTGAIGGTGIVVIRYAV